MKCKQHGWTYSVKRNNRRFCVLCRDLKNLGIDEQRWVNDWLASHEEKLAERSSSVFVHRISDLRVRSEDADGQSRLAPGEAVKGEVEADFFDGLVSRRGHQSEEGEPRVCISGINKGSIRDAAMKYGLSPSMVFRVRSDFEREGAKAATDRLLDYARRKLRRVA